MLLPVVPRSGYAHIHSFGYVNSRLTPRGTVEEIPYDLPDHPVRHRPVCRLLRECVYSSVRHASVAETALPPAYSYYAANYFPNLPHLGSCAGTETAAVFGCVLLTSYLGLFIQFYIQTYKKPAGRKAVANGKANGVANGCVMMMFGVHSYLTHTICSHKTE